MAVQRTAITGPFKGIISDLPPTVVPNGFEDSVNFIGWKGRQRSRPGLSPTGLVSPDGLPVLNMTSFEDIEGFLHTLALTLSSVEFLSGGVLNPLTSPTSYIQKLTIDSVGAGGYLVDDIVTITQGGATGGTAQVNSVDGSGNVTGLVLLTLGNGYVTATGLATGGGTGGGLTVDIIAGNLTAFGGGSSTRLPYAVIKANNRVYFCNGSMPLLYVDGEASFKIAGNVPGACRFLTANQNHLLGAFWTEPDPTQMGAIIYPRRLRWSDSGNYDQWDTSLDTSTAGVVDIQGIPDDITGLTTLSTYSYIYRTNGIGIAQPTGNALEPFYIPNYSVSPLGEGCKYPYTLSTLSNIDRFIGNYDVCSFDGTNLVHLMDEKCASKFFNDLQAAIGTVRGFHTLLLDNGFPFLGYVVTIPGTNIAWIYNITEQSWNRMVWQPPDGTTVGFFDLQFIEQVYLT